MGGYSATQIYQMFHSGPGTTGIYHATDGAATQMSTQDDLNNQIVQLNGKMASGWTGEASEQAMSGAVPLANAAQDATNALAVHQNVMNQQAEAFTTARNSLTNVPDQMPDNPMNDILAVFGDAGPLDDQITQYANSSANNVQVYQTYAQTSSLSAASMPQSYGQIPLSNATITVVAPSSTPGSGGYAAMNSVGFAAGGSAAEREAAMARLTAPPGAGGAGGASPEDETSGALSGTIDAPPGSDVNVNLPGLPNEPNLTTNAEGWTPPPTVEEDLPPGFFPGPGGSSNTDDEKPSTSLSSPPPSGNPNFSGELAPGAVTGAGPSGIGDVGGGGGGGAQNAMNSLRGGTGLGSSNPSDRTDSSRSGIGMTSQANEESLLGGGGGFGPGGAQGEEGGMGMGAGGMGGRREEDREHKSAQYLQEADPDALFGTDEMTAPRVIGE